MFHRTRVSLRTLDVPLAATLLVCGLSFLLASPPPLAAQATFGRIVINVIDSDGNPVAGVPVTAACEDLPRFSAKAKTNKRGKANISVVDATKVYQVTIAPEGAPTIIENIKPELGARGTERTVQLGNSGAALTAEEGAPEERSFTPAQTAFNEGVDALKADDLDLAEARFKKALDLEPELAAAHSALAGLYISKKDYDAALASAARLEELEGESGRLHRLRFEAYEGLGNDAEASKALKAMGRLDEGGDAAALAFNRGVEALRVGDLPAARKGFEDALQIDGNLTAALNALGTIELLQKRWAEAVAVADRVLAIEPQDRDALRTRYEALRQEGGAEDVAAAFAAFAAIDPEAVASNEFERGNDLFNAGETERALSTFERVLSIAPDHPHAHYRLGLCYLALEDSERARHHLERFIELAPEDSEVSSAKEMLQYLE